ncbi:hypothetical protein AWC38_SpisGene11459 [Stylophora pistillata]|uniref:Uncharacterized protein n=1 Tax=Stylophora pistillata TaxID=50429 RepID=A0A2B4RZT1_STYPI|nr:hypothetical protein AWC38_SpisGene11459 [Stylophora pistillata]
MDDECELFDWLSILASNTSLKVEQAGRLQSLEVVLVVLTLNDFHVLIEDESVRFDWLSILHDVEIAVVSNAPLEVGREERLRGPQIVFYMTSSLSSSAAWSFKSLHHLSTGVQYHNDNNSNTTNNNDRKKEKRVAKCAGCGTPIADHGWGFPSNYRQGGEISSPSSYKSRQKATAADDDEDQQIADLGHELVELDLEEQRKAKHRRIASLQRRI